MKSITITTALLLACVSIHAQTTNMAITEHNATVNTKDSLVKVQLIDPAEQESGDDEPDWAALTQTITQKYDTATADRTITKAKIYYLYNKDWPAFCTALIHYTDNYELANDFRVLNFNADMILKFSTDPAQYREALKWSKTAADGESENQQYQATYKALRQKINPQ